MRDFLIRLLGGKTKQDVETIRINNEMMKIDYEMRYINRSHLDYASDVLKRWNEYRGIINTLVSEIHKHNSSYFFEKEIGQSLFFEMVLQDYYFRRLYLLRYGQDFYDQNTGLPLKKAFWEVDPRYIELIYENNYIKKWNEFNEQEMNKEQITNTLLFFKEILTKQLKIWGSENIQISVDYSRIAYGNYIQVSFIGNNQEVLLLHLNVEAGYFNVPQESNDYRDALFSLGEKKIKCKRYTISCKNETQAEQIMNMLNKQYSISFIKKFVIK